MPRLMSPQNRIEQFFNLHDPNQPRDEKPSSKGSTSSPQKKEVVPEWLIDASSVELEIAP